MFEFEALSYECARVGALIMPGTQPAASIPVDMPLIDGHVDDKPFSGIGGTSGFLRMSLEAVK